MNFNRYTFLKMTLSIIVLFVASVFGVLNLPQFGKKASGLRRKRILASKNFKNGQFQNISYTPNLSENYTYFDIFKESLKKHPNKAPNFEIPHVKTDLNMLNLDENLLVWFGHSSYFMHFEGKRILVDPVFSGYAAPFEFMLKAFRGANIYGPNDMPEIDILIITHDHYDHLDYQTIKKLKPKIKLIVTSLGVGEHLEAWGFEPEKIIELDWDETHKLPDLQIIAATSRHFSGRSLSPKTTLWGSFILKGRHENIYIGGDSGYDSHFKKIGDDHGPFGLVILDGGQYNKQWKDIHMIPEESAQAAKDLQAEKLFLAHWAKFSLAHHAWNEPAERITAACNNLNIPYFTTKIGEVNNWKIKTGGETWWLG